MYVSVNAHTIRANAKHGTNKAPIRIARTKSDKNPVYAKEVALSGDVKMLYTPDGAILSCGARLVIQADKVVIIK